MPGSSRRLAVHSLAMKCSQVPLVGGVGLNIQPKRVLALVKPGNSKGSAVLGAVAGRLGAVNNDIFLKGRSVERLASDRVSERLSVIVARHVRARLLDNESIITAKHCPCAKELNVLSRRS